MTWEKSWRKDCKRLHKCTWSVFGWRNQRIL